MQLLSQAQPLTNNQVSTAQTNIPFPLPLPPIMLPITSQAPNGYSILLPGVECGSLTVQSITAAFQNANAVVQSQTRGFQPQHHMAFGTSPHFAGGLPQQPFMHPTSYNGFLMEQMAQLQAMGRLPNPHSSPVEGINVSANVCHTIFSWSF